MSYICSLCEAAFTTSSHLRRHEVRHYGGRVFTCAFCSKAFQRSDTARRHETTCPRKGNRPIPQGRRRGQPRQACDACALARGGCTGGQPCARCIEKGLNCSYERLQEDPAIFESESSIEPSETHPQSRNLAPDIDPKPLQMGTSRNESSEVKSIPISFLLNFTDVSTRSLTRRFDHTDTPDENASTQAGTSASTQLEFDPFMLPPFQASFFENPFGHGFFPDPTHFEQLHSPGFNIGLISDMDIRIAELISTLEANINHMSSQPEATHSLNHSPCDYTLFEPDMAPLLIQSYFNRWHRHCPIVHRATFNAESASLPLLLAVMLMGAMFHSRGTADMALSWLDVAEDYIFGHENFRYLASGDSHDKSKHKLEALQAAFTMVVIQSWGRDLVSRRRMRLHRHVDVVSAARSLKLTATKHPHRSANLPPVEEWNWPEWTYTEERIRTAAYIYLVDCAWMIFHGTPPRMTTQEMFGDPPSEERIFEAETATACYEILLEQPYRSITSLADTTRLLLDNSEFPESGLNLSILHFFMLVHALHVVIFTSKTTCMISLTSPSLHRALQRYNFIWNLQINTTHPDELALVGFYKTAPEYCRLGSMLLDAEEDPKFTNGPVVLDQDSMETVNVLLRRFSNLVV